MEIHRFDGGLISRESVSESDVMEAMRDPANRRVIVRMPGDVFDRWEHGTRKRYRVTDEGKLQRLTLGGEDWPE